MPATARVRSPQAHFLGVGANLDHCLMASPSKTGGQHGDDPVNITTLK